MIPPGGRGWRLATIPVVTTSTIVPSIVVSARARGRCRTGYRRVGAVANPGGDEEAEMASDCRLVHGGVNPACIDGPGSMNDDSGGGREGHRTHPIRCRYRTMNL